MFTKQIGSIGGAASDVFSRDQWRVIQEIFGNCQQPLEHNGPVTIEPTFPSTATQAALTVSSWQKGGGEGATGIALEINGTINYNGSTFAPLFPGAIMPFSGTAAQLAVWNANGWYTCDGTNGTIDLRDRFIVCNGSTYTATGGAATHNHGAATGSGGTGATGADGTGATGASGTGATGSSTTGITVTAHSGEVTGAASGNTASGQASISGSFASHTHSIAVATIVQSGTGVTVSAVASTGATDGSISATDAGHVHGLNSHTHTIPTLSHSVVDSGHTHTGPSHTHTGPSHTHTGPAHTHTISSDSNIPPYYALTFLMFVG